MCDELETEKADPDTMVDYYMFNDTELDLDCVPGEYAEDADFDPWDYVMIPNPSVPEPVPTWEIALKLTFYVGAILMDLVGNSLVVLIVVVNKKMRTSTNCLILNLAVSDLMIGIFCMWVHAGHRITTEWPFDQFVCKFAGFAQVLAVTSSVLTLTAISVERFFAIVFPLKYRFSPQFVAVVVTTTWLISVAMAAPLLFVNKRYEMYWSNRHEIWCQEAWRKVYVDSACNTKDIGRIAYYTISGIVMFFVPIVVMVAAYTLIVIKMFLRKLPGSRVPSTAVVQDRARRKVVRMLIIILAVFVVCWTPQQVLLLWGIYRDRTNPMPPYIGTVKYVAVYIAYLSSSINPILYGGFNENFRRGFREAFHGRLWKNRNVIAPASRGMAGSNTTAADGTAPVPVTQ